MKAGKPRQYFGRGREGPPQERPEEGTHGRGGGECGSEWCIVFLSTYQKRWQVGVYRARDS